MGGMKKALPVLFLIMLAVSGCGDKLVEEVDGTWPGGSPKKVSVYRMKGDQKDKVKEILYYENGKKQMEGSIVNGRKDGAWTSWFENGRKQSEGFFRNDMRDGKAVVWRENGFRYYEGTYSLGKLHGTWITYDVDGSRYKETLYEYDRKVNEIDYKKQ